MENLNLDLGAVEYRITGGGVLRFNPADPNVYGRFLDARQDLERLQKAFQKKAKAAKEGAQVLALLQEADRALKDLLGLIFPGNDFDEAVGGVNLLAVNPSGKTVAESLLTALEDILSRGAKSLVDAEAAKLRQ